MRGDDARGCRGLNGPAPPHASFRELLGLFTKLGMASFGGGLAGWMHHEVVHRRGWMTEEGFLAGVALGQVMPGANSVNLALYIGLQLRGLAGAAAAFIGLLGPPFLFILGLMLLYQRIAGLPGLAAVLVGVAAAGIGNNCVVGLRTALTMRRVGPWLVTIAVFVSVGLLRWPMLPVILVMAPIGIGLAARAERGHAL